MNEKPAIYRYVVTARWGEIDERLQPGAVIVETEYRGIYGDWTIADMETGKPIGGWSGRYLGKANESMARTERSPGQRMAGCDR